MSFRLWYPQLDVYDAIRRFGNLIANWNFTGPSIEHLFIIDFYYANPPLLHETHMPSEVRDEFRKLKMQRPDKTFLSYPSAPILFHKMQPVQKQALQTLAGKGLVEEEWMKRGEVHFSSSGTYVFNNLRELIPTEEKNLIEFLVKHFSSIGADDIVSLRRNTGLRKASL